MVTYEITATVDSGLVEEYESYLRQRHIPDLLATGCFHRAVLTCAPDGRYRIRYEPASEADLEQYLAKHAPRLRADFKPPDNSYARSFTTTATEAMRTATIPNAVGRPAASATTPAPSAPTAYPRSRQKRYTPRALARHVGPATA